MNIFPIKSIAIVTLIDKIPVKSLEVLVYKFPTKTPEADGTIEWNSTTMVLTRVTAGGHTGIGYTYASEAAATVINQVLKECVIGKNVLDTEAMNLEMIRAIRNNGNCGIAMMAVSSVDNALWDLKARALQIPLCKLIGSARNEMLVYGSGGFTSYTDEQLTEQLGGWVDEGICFVKMKIGTHFSKDPHRIAVARKAIGKEAGLFVDANGAYTTRQALLIEEQCRKYRIDWFEEPVTSDNLEGLHFIRQHSDANTNIAAGEYGYNIYYFQKMLKAQAVDILQADATRCGGITNYLKAGALAEAYQIPFSSHCAPSLHLHPSLSLPAFYIAEYFFDHVRIEKMAFDGFNAPENGCMKPDLSRPGNGLTLKEKDVEKFKI